MSLLPLSMRYPFRLRRVKPILIKTAVVTALVLIGVMIGRGSPLSLFRAKHASNGLVSSETARWEWFYRQLRADKRWFLFQLNLPASALHYQRVPSGVFATGSVKASGRSFPVVAVPRQFEAQLQRNGIAHLDPRVLPDSYFSEMTEKRKTLYRASYLWVPDVSRHQSRFFE